nr:hypothetical protein [Tanacetum cinerariifolium]
MAKPKHQQILCAWLQIIPRPEDSLLVVFYPLCELVAPLPPAVTNKVAAPSLPVPKKKPPVPVKPPVKPPYPHTKYLSQILSVPKPDQLCGDDDLEWLFNRKKGKKPPADDPWVQVWSEAKHIESVGVWDWPYVIPY